jgi:hypothetical protein
MSLSTIFGLLKAVAVLVAAILLGNWFLAEAKAARAKGRPKYAAYLTLPGILIVVVILLPVLMWLMSR